MKSACVPLQRALPKKKFAVTTNILELWELRCPPKIQYSVRILVIVRDRNFAACNYSHDAYARSLAKYNNGLQQVCRSLPTCVTLYRCNW